MRWRDRFHREKIMNDKTDIKINNFEPIPLFDFRFTTVMLFRSVNREYAESFCAGKIYLGTPKNWIEIEKKGNKGQGDLLEGVVFSFNSDNNSDFIKELTEDENYECFTYNGFTYFRRKSILDLRCLCLYGVHDNSFEKSIDEYGRAHYISRVSSDYFSDFCEVKSREEYKKMESSKQPVVIFIKNIQEFIGRIRKKLVSLGVKEEEIIISPVEYLNRDTEMLVQVPYPKELLIKDISFQKQSEVRIIINSISEEYLTYMREHNNILDVGSLEDITEIYNYYFNDMEIVRNGRKKAWISLPEERKQNIKDFDFKELLQFLLRILSGEIRITGLPDNCTSWQDKTKLIEELLYSKYDILFFIDDNRNMTFQNVSPDLQKVMDDVFNRTADRLKNEIELLLAQGKTEEALNKCLESINDNALVGTAHYYLGKIYTMQGKIPEAINAYWNAYNNDYKSIESLDGIASIYYNMGDYLKAIEMYKTIQEVKGYDVMIWGDIGVCYNALHQYNKAIEYFDNGIKKDNNDAFLYYNKGVSHYWLKQYDLAKQNMKKAIELEPTNEFYTREYNKFINYLNQLNETL